jgi:uncharacterized protein (TIGR02246 family)
MEPADLSGSCAGPRPGRRGRPLTVLLAIALLLSAAPACRRSSERRAAPPRDTQAEGREEPETIGSPADLEAIARLRDEYLGARNTGDVDRFERLWTADGVLLPVDEPAVIGREAVADYIADFLDQNAGRIEVHPEEVRVAGDWAFERGTETIASADEATGEALEIAIKYVAVLFRQPDGTWRIGRYMFNFDESEPIDEEPAESVTC